MTDSAATEALLIFSRRVAAEFPEVKAVLDLAASKKIDEVEAMRRLAELATRNPDLQKRIEALASEMTAPLRAGGSEGSIQGSVGDRLLFDPGVGQPKLNPLYEAALIERAQFDGDIPELRTGGLPDGATPAISVQTTARNPVAVGQMLDHASRRVLDDIENKQGENRRLLQAVAEGDTLALVARAGADLALRGEDAIDRLLDGRDPAMDVPSYPRGQVPAPLTVETPSGSTLAVLTPEEQRTHAWRFLSTTPGRRSAISSIRLEILRFLTKHGFEVVEREAQGSPVEPVVARHEWSVRIDGPGSTQSSFALIDIAAKVMGKSLLDQMAARRGRVILEVAALNTVDVRSVGWGARLLGVDRVLHGEAT